MKMKINGSLKGTDQKAYTAIKESMTTYTAVSEFFHNSTEHGQAGAFWFKHYLSNDPTIQFVTEIGDNGKGMSKKTFEKFIKDYKCHEQTSSIINGSSISQFGMGAKDAIVYLCNPKDGAFSRVTIFSYYKDRAYKWEWIICSSEASKGYYDGIIEEIDNLEGRRGLVIKIENARPLTEIDIKTTREELGGSFTLEKPLPTVTITIGEDLSKNNKIQWCDRMHFELFPGEPGAFRTCPDGVYNSKEIVWFKKTIIGTNENNECVKVPVITAYINREYWDKYHRNSYDTILTPNCGVYALKGNCYITRGGNAVEMLEITPNSGGSPRVRQCVIIDDSNVELFETKTMKMCGIKPFSKNHLMVDVFKDENGDSIYKAIQKEYSNLRGKFQNWVRNLHKEYNHEDYSKGFPDNETFKTDLEEYRNIKLRDKKVENDDEDKYFRPSQKSVLYDMEGTEYPINRITKMDGDFNEYTIHSSNFEFDDTITKEDILYTIFDILYEVEVSPKDYKEVAKLFKKRVHHYEE